VEQITTHREAHRIRNTGNPFLEAVGVGAPRSLRDAAPALVLITYVPIGDFQVKKLTTSRYASAEQA
jgi:hypothetical protein